MFSRGRAIALPLFANSRFRTRLGDVPNIVKLEIAFLTTFRSVRGARTEILYGTRDSLFEKSQFEYRSCGISRDVQTIFALLRCAAATHIALVFDKRRHPTA
jgi:hypothetical protein